MMTGDHAGPDSCGPHNPLATEFVKLLAGGLQSEFQQVQGMQRWWSRLDQVPLGQVVKVELKAQ